MKSTQDRALQFFNYYLAFLKQPVDNLQSPASKGYTTSNDYQPRQSFVPHLERLDFSCYTQNSKWPSTEPGALFSFQSPRSLISGVHRGLKYNSSYQCDSANLSRNKSQKKAIMQEFTFSTLALVPSGNSTIPSIFLQSDVKGFSA